MSTHLSQPGDEAFLSQLHAQCFAEVWSASYIASLLATPGTFAMLDECRTGFIILRVAGDESEVLTLAVTPAARRRGVASELVTNATLHASVVGVKAVFLEVDSANSPALALYKRLGLVEVGCRKAYYPVTAGHYHDALVLRGEVPLPRVSNCMQLG